MFFNFFTLKKKQNHCLKIPLNKVKESGHTAFRHIIHIFRQLSCNIWFTNFCNNKYYIFFIYVDAQYKYTKHQTAVISTEQIKVYYTHMFPEN